MRIRKSTIQLILFLLYFIASLKLVNYIENL
jgi:hypothetical protein